MGDKVSKATKLVGWGREKGERFNWERKGNKQRTIIKTMLMLKFLCTGRAKKVLKKNKMWSQPSDCKYSGAIVIQRVNRTVISKYVNGTEYAAQTQNKVDVEFSTCV